MMKDAFAELNFVVYPTRARPGQGTRAAAAARRRIRHRLSAAVVAKPGGQPKKAAKVSAKKRAELKRLGLSDADFRKLEAEREAKAAELAKADKLHDKLTAPVGQDKVVRKIAARQALITLPKVTKDQEEVDYEIYTDIQTKFVFKRKAPDPDGDDPMKVSKKPPEDEIWSIVKRFKKARRGTEAWDAAERIWKVIVMDENPGGDTAGVRVEGETKTYELYICGPFTLKFGQEAWVKKRGKFAGRFKRRGKQGDPSSQEAATIIRQTARGELRILVQNKLRKEKTQLIDGDMFEGGYASLYRFIKKEITPDDEDDPSPTAMPEWLHDALPDKAQA